MGLVFSRVHISSWMHSNDAGFDEMVDVLLHDEESSLASYFAERVLLLLERSNNVDVGHGVVSACY